MESGPAIQAAIQTINGGGDYLPDSVRNYFEPRFGYDFSRVRIHADSKAADSADKLNARAYAMGRDITFGNGEYSPETLSGKRLLAHELAHVVQQAGDNIRISRQVPPGPTFSVVRADYERLVNSAVQNMSGNVPASTTFTPVAQPILQSLLASLVWRDSSGADHGGGPVQYAVPDGSGTTLTLTLVLDDMVDPPEAGLFRHSGNDGRIFVRVRRNAGREELTEVLYHESMHMMSWIISAHPGAMTGIDARAVRGLDMSRFRTQIAAIRSQLERLGGGVNARRRSSGRSELNAADYDATAKWLMEEVQVRAETEVFQQTLQVERQRGQRAQVYMPTQQYGSINRDMVDKYVFDFSTTFMPDDRTGLTSDDREILRILTDTLEGFFQLHVRRRFSLNAHTVNIPHTSPVYTPPPLEPPSFLPRILESVQHEPF